MFYFIDQSVEIYRQRLKVFLCVALALMAVALVALAGCSSLQGKSESDQVTGVTLRGLQTASEFRVFALNTAKTFWRKGMLSEEVAARIITVGDALQQSINTTSVALELWVTSEGMNADDLNEKVKLYQEIYTEFSALVTPYIMEIVNDGEP